MGCGAGCARGWLAVWDGCLALLKWKKDWFFSMGPLKFPNLSNAIAVRIERRRINEEWLFFWGGGGWPGRGYMCWEKWSFKNVESWSYRTGDIRNTWNIYEICVPGKVEPWSMACSWGTTRFRLGPYTPWAAYGGPVQCKQWVLVSAKLLGWNLQRYIEHWWKSSVTFFFSFQVACFGCWRGYEFGWMKNKGWGDVRAGAACRVSYCFWEVTHKSFWWLCVRG